MPKSVFKGEVTASMPIEAGDKVVQMMINERYDITVVLDSGRMFRQRARGHSGAYDQWKEIDLLAEIKADLKI